MRITTRAEAGRAAIEATGAECWIGTPERLATLRAALESVTIVCWLLGTVAGEGDELSALHGSRLEFFLGRQVGGAEQVGISQHGSEGIVNLVGGSAHQLAE